MIMSASTVKVGLFLMLFAVGLTATPALHTKEIFNNPIYNYSLREAVLDGY